MLFRDLLQIANILIAIRWPEECFFFCISKLCRIYIESVIFYQRKHKSKSKPTSRVEVSPHRSQRDAWGIITVPHQSHHPTAWTHVSPPGHLPLCNDHSGIYFLHWCSWTPAVKTSTSHTPLWFSHNLLIFKKNAGSSECSLWKTSYNGLDTTALSLAYWASMHISSFILNFNCPPDPLLNFALFPDEFFNYFNTKIDAIWEPIPTTFDCSIHFSHSIPVQNSFFLIHAFSSWKLSSYSLI